jgi:RHS repeat-associated protein
VTRAYDNRNRPTDIRHRQSGGTNIVRETYVWDDAGNLTSKTIGSNTVSYTYDAADQLLSETRGTWSSSYTYDGNGNRLTKTLNGVTDSYSYDDGDKLLQITRGGNTIKSYGYDSAGRTTSVTTSSGTTTLSYDYESRVTSITYPNNSSNTFSYNGLDTRVSKVDSAGTTSYLRDGAYVTDPVLIDTATSYTPGISTRSGGATRYQHSDWIGSNIRQTDGSNTITSNQRWDAFGMLLASSGTRVGPFGFAGEHGYQTDPDSGLQLLGHRYYDPSTGRFLTRDPIKDGRNWYAYGANNPLKYIDPDGRLIWKLVIAAIIIIDIIDTANDVKEIIEEPTEPENYIWPVVGAIDPTPGNGLKRVGRWMRRVEYDRMVDTGKVQPSVGAGGREITHAVSPPDPGGFTNPKPGSEFIIFDVPESNVLPGGRDGWVNIVGGGDPVFGGKVPGDGMPGFENLFPWPR